MQGVVLIVAVLGALVHKRSTSRLIKAVVMLLEGSIVALVALEYVFGWLLQSLLQRSEILTVLRQTCASSFDSWSVQFYPVINSMSDVSFLIGLAQGFMIDYGLSQASFFYATFKASADFTNTNESISLDSPKMEVTTSVQPPLTETNVVPSGL